MEEKDKIKTRPFHQSKQYDKSGKAAQEIGIIFSRD